LCRCSEVGFDTSAVYGTGSSFHNTTHLDGQPPCAGDDLTEGVINVCESNGKIRVKVVTNHDWNLYTVYWLRLGGHPVLDKIFIGEFYTEEDGTADFKLVRNGGSGSIGDTTVDDLQDSSNDVDFYSAIGSSADAGNFLLYSRGPIIRNGDWNTNNGQSSGIVNNPELWNSMPDGGYAGVQFIDCV